MNPHTDMERLNTHIQKCGIATISKRYDTSCCIIFCESEAMVSIKKTFDKQGQPIYSLREHVIEGLEFEYEIASFKALAEVVKEEYINMRVER